MNNKIKIIELLLKIAHGEYPKRFKYNNKIYEYKRTITGTGYVTENDNWFNSDIFIDDWENLNEEVEILEDNIEEIEEIPQYRIDNCTNRNYAYLATKYNELVKAIKQLNIKLANTDK